MFGLILSSSVLIWIDTAPSAQHLSVRLAKVFEDVIELAVQVAGGDDVVLRQLRHAAVEWRNMMWRRAPVAVAVQRVHAILLAERQQNAADLCNDLLYSGIRLLQQAKAAVGLRSDGLVLTADGYFKILEVVHDLLVVHVELQAVQAG